MIRQAGAYASANNLWEYSLLYKSQAAEYPLSQDIDLVRIDLFRTEVHDPTLLNFLYQVYKSTRIEEMAACGWSESQIDLFLTQQFQLQHRAYTTRDETAFYLIRYRERDCGRLYLDCTEEEIRIVDIALLPEFRGKGIGTLIFNRLKAEGRELNLPLTLHVAVFNPCRRLYRRLGFLPGKSDGIYTAMSLAPEPG